MSVPMSRTISRPFGRSALTPSTASAPAQRTASAPSAQPDYVLQDAAEDTPHDIHPHAAAYASQQTQPLDLPANRTKTLRQMTHAERVAWAQLAGKTSAYGQPHPEQGPGSPAGEVTASSPSAASSVTVLPGDTSRPYTYGNSAAPWGASNDHLRWERQPWSDILQPEQLTASAPTASAPAFASTPSAPSAAAPLEQEAVATPSAPSAVPPPALASPLAFNPPARTTSLAYRLSAPAALTVSSASRTPELEIVISRPNGQDVTIRVFAPPPH